MKIEKNKKIGALSLFFFYLLDDIFIFFFFYMLKCNIDIKFYILNIEKQPWIIFISFL